MAQLSPSWVFTQRLQISIIIEISVFIAAQFTIVKLQNQPRCSSREKWIRKMWYICTIEFFSTIKKTEAMSFVGKRMQLETQRQSQKGNLMFSLLCSSCVVYSHIKSCVYALNESGSEIVYGESIGLSGRGGPRKGKGEVRRQCMYVQHAVYS